MENRRSLKSSLFYRRPVAGFDSVAGCGFVPACFGLPPASRLIAVLLSASLLLGSATTTALLATTLLPRLLLITAAALFGISGAVFAFFPVLFVCGLFFQGLQADLSHIGVNRFYLFGFAAYNFNRFPGLSGRMPCYSNSLSSRPFNGEVLLVAVGQTVPHQVAEDVFSLPEGPAGRYFNAVGIFGEESAGASI